MSPDLRREVERLASALCDGDLSDPDRDRLDQLLAADPECRRAYLELIDLHAALLARPGRPLPSPPPSTEPDRPAARERLLASYGVVAACTLAVSLVAQVVLRPTPGPGGAPPGGGPDSAADYVATLTYAADCEWEPGGDPPRVGARLAPGEARLRQGLAQIRFDSGADLLIEGPARFRLNSPGSATVFQGKVVFRADETVTPFDLRTPTASLVDFGTEYAVAIGLDGGEEVHVFEGEVRRTPSGDLPAGPGEQLRAGEARRYDAAVGDAGHETPLDPGRFVRRTPGPAPAGGLLAHEGFDYADAEGLPAGRAGGGVGWDGPWVFGFARPVGDAPPAGPPLNVREGLRRPGSATPVVGGSFDYTGFAKAFRKLKTPVRLDADGVYYLSYLFRHHGPPADPVNAVAILLWPDPDARAQEGDRQRRLNVGVAGANQVFTHLQGVGSRTPLPLTYGETYLLVAKVVASRDHPDQVFIRVYAPLEPVDRDESDGWSVTGPPFQSDLVFDWVQLHVNSGRRQTIDEFRLGTTWASVTAPWVRGPEQKK